MNLQFQSVGCEFQAPIFDRIPSLVRERLLQHIQVTIPSSYTYHTAQSLASGLDVIAHCNLLNVFGDNNWTELRFVSQQVRGLSPVHVVEHFTAFRAADGKKFGAYFNKETVAKLDSICETIQNWQEILGLPVALENVPLAHSVREYFDLLLTVKSRTKCAIACDLPHFFLSAYSAGLQDREIEGLAQALDPIQLHVGGLTVSEGRLKDNHKVFSPWLVSEGSRVFSRSKYITLEQSHVIPGPVVERILRAIHRNETQNVAEDMRTGQGLSLDELNEELAADTAKYNEFPRFDRTCDVALTSEIDISALSLYERYLPFMYPVTSLARAFAGLQPTDAVRVSAGLARWALSYLSWWSPGSPMAATISYGEGSSPLYEAVVGERSQVDRMKVRSARLRLESRKGFWVEVATPIAFELKNAAEREGMLYDKRTV